MDKSPDAFRTISEVADDLDMPQHVLRFWETRFTQIKPLKRGGGRRYYRPDDVDLLKGLKRLLYGEGYTIKGVQRILKEQGARHVVAIGRGAPVAGAEIAEALPHPPVAHAPGSHVSAQRAQAEMADSDPHAHHDGQASRPPFPAVAPLPPRDSPQRQMPQREATSRLKAALFELGEARAGLARINSPQMSGSSDD